MNLAQAKAQLSAVIDRVEAGETIEITRRGKVAARIVPVEAEKRAVDVGALCTLRATTTPWREELGICFVQWARETDQL